MSPRVDLRLLAALLALTACGTRPAAAPQDAFFERVSALCGNAYAGAVAADDTADPSFAGKPLVMHVRDCSADVIRVPFHVGDDRSRTWVLSRTANGLRLKHDHRHADGSEDALTQYGGDTTAPGDARRQQFPVDSFSKAMFAAQKRNVSLTNVWAVEVEPGAAFVYELARPGGRLLRVRFDLSRPVPAPPPPWGADRPATVAG